MKFPTAISRLAGLFILLCVSFNSYADDLIMMRVKQSFPETMTSLQIAIKKAGYTISRVQRVDIGLTKSGFKTDKYRVVFFGKAEEVETLLNQYPDLAAFLPLKISIFAENNDTILVSNNPIILQRYFKQIPEHYFTRWEKDVQKIFSLASIED
ncbi:MAG: DUF302 domain-containing protein [Gammaproteobacteria bacterium]|nr:DUF302 domain-containing protein [Gammaproteobacteria bacterium]